MISNIKLQQMVAQSDTRAQKSVSNTANVKSDAQSSDQYVASDLAALVKGQLQGLADQSNLEKVLALKQLNNQGLYNVDVQALAQTLLNEYR